MANAAVRAGVLVACKEIEPTIPSPIARRCGSVVFNQSWPSVIPNMAVVWVFIGGSWNGPSVGSISCADFEPATNADMTSTKLSSHSGALSSVVTSSNASFC